MSAVNTQTRTPANETPPVSSDTSMSTLLGGIVSDLQKLFEDHLHLLRLEVEEDLQTSKRAMLPMAVGGSLLLTAFLLFLVSLIGCLAAWYPSIPWYGWSGILCGIFLVIGLILFLVGSSTWHSFNPLPDKTLGIVKRTMKHLSKTRQTSKS
jgi:hypothetical protein